MGEREGRREEGKNGGREAEGEEGRERLPRLTAWLRYDI